MAYEYPNKHRREHITKLRWREDEIDDLRREAALAGMQLSTYIRELSQMARAMGAADAVRAMHASSNEKQDISA